MPDGLDQTCSFEGQLDTGPAPGLVALGMHAVSVRQSSSFDIVIRDDQIDRSPHTFADALIRG